MKNVLVTGGAGYVGSLLVPELLESGHKVTVVDNFSYKQPSLAALIRNPNLELVIGDVRNYSLLEPLLRSADIIIPLAAIVGAPACSKDPALAKSINLDATLWLLSKIGQSQQVIMPTTNSAYGSGDSSNYCDEQSPLNPLSLYAKDKVIIEESLMRIKGATSFRLATVFGISPRMRLDLLVNNFVYRALTDGFIVLFEGHFKRNYIHISDVVRAFSAAIENPEPFLGEIFNVGLSSANISKKELCEKIKTFVPSFFYSEAPLGKDPDQRNYIVSNNKIESLGVIPQVSLDSGIKELVKGIRMFQQQPYTNLT